MGTPQPPRPPARRHTARAQKISLLEDFEAKVMPRRPEELKIKE